jgi:hypothetical protein
MNLKIDALTKRLDTLNVSWPISAANTLTVESCSICASPMHLAQTCPPWSVFSENQMEQVNPFNDFRKQSSGPYSKTYNPGWRNHPNFSWKQNQLGSQGEASQAQNQYPLGFPPTYRNHGRSAQPVSSSYQAPTSSTQSLEDTMRDFMKMTGQPINDVRNSTIMNTQAIAKLEM